MKFRLAKLSDLSVLNTISLESKRHWGYPSQWIDRWKEDLLLSRDSFKQQKILIVENEQKAIGFCSMMENERFYEVLHLWLLPEFIGKGNGKLLLSRAMEAFVKTKKPVRVEADPNAQAFYEKMGFVLVDQVESYPPGRFLPILRKETMG